ncbi:MAG TPA: GNAT family N-acetyltransferase [Kofleriaceae bacterium]|nr:GNAT family N-acetyltransferase [Kofleriaceae bacterium]
MFFGPDYQEHACLRDGTPVLLRLIRPDDKELLRRGFLRLSPESRYRRFFAAKVDLTPDELRYLTEVDGVDHVALGAVTADGRNGLGVARFIRLAGERGTAEAAIAVVDEIQGKGLGSLLFQRLVAAARERGVERFRCDMLGSNRGMVDLVLASAPDASAVVHDGVVSMEFRLPPLGPEHPAAEPPRESGLYRLFAMVARGALEWTSRWQELGLRLMGGVDSDSWDGSRD